MSDTANSTAADQWYCCTIERKALKGLMRRSDRRGLAQLAAYLAILIACGWLADRSLGSWWVVSAFLLYGGVWVFATSIVHETCHGTAFRTRWLNETVLFAAGVMVQQTPSVLRWTHARHHSQTAINGEDVEIILRNPMTWRGLIFRELIDLASIWYYAKTVPLLSLGLLDRDIRRCVPESEMPRAICEARAFLAIYVAIGIWALAAGSWWPIVMFLLPRLAGAPVHGVMLASQHIGLAQDIRDHRATTRTMTLNPLARLIYWNMNYHIEHHMFPLVPFHALPALHQAIKHDCPPPTRGISGALAEIFATVARQRRDPAYVTPKPLPTKPMPA